MLIKDIQVFIGFANFYQRFIQGFNRIAKLLTSILKTTRLANSVPKALEVDYNKIVEKDGRADKMVRNLSKSTKLKNNKSGNAYVY